MRDLRLAGKRSAYITQVITDLATMKKISQPKRERLEQTSCLPQPFSLLFNQSAYLVYSLRSF